MREFINNSDIPMAPSPYVNESEVSFTSAASSLSDSFLHSVTSDTSNKTDNSSFSLISANATVQVTGTQRIHFPPDMLTFVAVCMILIAATGIVGNFISICALSLSKKLNRITTAFIVNLCVADFFIACFRFWNSITIYRTNDWNGGNDTCMPYNILVFFFSSGVIFTINAITLNRYVLIAHPDFYYTMYRMRNTAIMIGSVWVISAVMTLLPHFDVWGRYGYDPKTGECAVIDPEKKTKIYSFIVKYCMSFVLLLLCYVKIFYVVHKAEKKTGKPRRGILSHFLHLSDKFWLGDKENPSARPSYKQLRNKKEWRLFRTIIVIFLCFTLSFIPLTALKISRKEREYPKLYILCHLAMHLANVVNPVIYVALNKEYRKAHKKFFGCFVLQRVNKSV